MISVTVQKPGDIATVKKFLKQRDLYVGFYKRGGVATCVTSAPYDSASEEPWTAELSEMAAVTFEKTVDDAGGNGSTSGVAASGVASAAAAVPTFETVFAKFAAEHSLDTQEFAALVPKKWSLYPPMVLLKSGTLDDARWQQVPQFSSLCRQWLATCFPNFTHIAVNRPILESDNVKRLPRLVPVYGDFGTIDADFDHAFWCTVKQNGITQCWAPRHVMFSRGNIKEKARVLTFENVRDKVVVDLYAGIGYFTLSYAAQQCKHVFCWEINPWSVEGLRRGCAANGISCRVVRHEEPFEYDSNVRVFVFLESNEFAAARFAECAGDSGPLAITHINMGLLPSSRDSWAVAEHIRGLSSENTVLHVHENVKTADIETYGQEVAQSLKGHLVHSEKIKTFAPDVWHVCYDVEN